MNKTETINLEDLISQTEQKIMNSEYYDDCQVKYKNLLLNVRIRPLAQQKFVNITQDEELVQSGKFVTEVLTECIINKETNEPFTRKQINELFTGGLAMALLVETMKVSGLSLNDIGFQKEVDF